MASQCCLYFCLILKSSQQLCFTPQESLGHKDQIPILEVDNGRDFTWTWRYLSNSLIFYNPIDLIISDEEKIVQSPKVKYYSNNCREKTFWVLNFQSRIFGWNRYLDAFTPLAPNEYSTIIGRKVHKWSFQEYFYIEMKILTVVFSNYLLRKRVQR